MTDIAVNGVAVREVRDVVVVAMLHAVGLGDSRADCGRTARADRGGTARIID